MESLENLSSAQAVALLGICFDIDDTVTSHGVLDPEAYRSLFALRASGLKLIAATGRPLGFAEVMARTWPVDAAVGENGAGFVARLGRALSFGYWDDLEVRESQRDRLRAIRARVKRELPQVVVSSDAWARRCDLAFDVGEHHVLAREEIDALLSIIASEGARPSVSSIHAHAQLGTHDKARGIVQAAGALWGFEEERVRTGFLFVGDSGNDAAAFSFFALSAGVANIERHLDRLPVRPTFLARAECGAGFAEIAQAIVARRRP